MLYLVATKVVWLILKFRTYRNLYVSLHWHHNDHNGVSNHQPGGCLLNRLFRRRSQKTSTLRVTGLCVGNSPGTGEFPAQMASNAENISIWWRHHDNCMDEWMCRSVVNMQGINTKSEHLQAISSNDSTLFQYTNLNCYSVCRLYLLKTGTYTFHFGTFIPKETLHPLMRHTNLSLILSCMEPGVLSIYNDAILSV